MNAPQVARPTNEDIKLLHLPWGHQIVDNVTNLVLLAYPDPDAKNPKSPIFQDTANRHKEVVGLYRKLADNRLNTRQMREVLGTVIKTGRLLGTPNMQKRLIDLGLITTQPDTNGNYHPVYDQAEPEPK